MSLFQLPAVVLIASTALSFGFQESTRLIVKDHKGNPKLLFGPRDVKPTKWPERGDVQLFFERRDIKDDRGRIVSGLGFVAWTAGREVRIAVFILVPKPGAPNTFLADNPATTRNLVMELFDEVGVSLGSTIVVDKLKKLGADTVSVVFETAKEIPRLSGRERWRTPINCAE